MFKQDEIDLLEKFAAEVNDHDGDLYLKSLFTPEFVGWVSQAIRDDVCPDIHAWGIHGDKELNATIAALNEELDEIKRKVVRLERTVEVQKEELEKTDKQVERLMRERAEMQTGWDNDANALYEARIDVEELELTVIKLKAKLYDKLVLPG